MTKLSIRMVVILGLCILMLSSPAVMASKINDAESKTHDTDASLWRIVDTYTFKSFKVIQFELPVLSIYSYMLISNGEALVIDPGRDAKIFIDTAKKENYRIKGVYVTHSHADFIAGHTEILNETKSKIYQSKKSGVTYSFEPLEENSSISIGDARIEFLETPGHTPDGMCAVVYEKGEKKTPVLVFTGDVLFVGSVGRPDLLGGKVSASWLAKAMFHSWTEKISKLPDEVKVFPAHGAGSLCGAHLSDDPFSTIGREKKTNPYLKHTSEGSFVAALLQGLPEAPQYFTHNVRINQNGPTIIKWDKKMSEPLQATQDLINSTKYWVLDLRDADDYANGHIPNSVNIALRGRLETWVGIMVPWESDLVIVGSEKEIEEAIYRLHRVGYAPKYITMDAWTKAGMPIQKTETVEPSALYEQMKNGTAPLIIDVRLKDEWMGLRIGTVLNVPLNELQNLSGQLEPKDPVVTVCNSAYRSSMAVGILERKGFTRAMNLKGGSEAWINSSYPVFQETTSQSQASVSPSFKRYVNLAERISPSSLNQMLMDTPGTFDLVDIRPPEFYNDYNLPGSINIAISDLLENTAYLVGPAPLVIVDRDGSVAMMVGGILSQKTQRPIKVLSGGLESYWSQNSGAVRQNIPIPPPKTNAPAAPSEPSPKKKKSAGC